MTEILYSEYIVKCKQFLCGITDLKYLQVSAYGTAVF
jgi:hypothetical protein